MVTLGYVKLAKTNQERNQNWGPTLSSQIFTPWLYNGEHIAMYLQYITDEACKTLSSALRKLSQTYNPTTEEREGDRKGEGGESGGKRKESREEE